MVFFHSWSEICNHTYQLGFARQIELAAQIVAVRLQPFQIYTILNERDIAIRIMGAVSLQPCLEFPANGDDAVSSVDDIAECQLILDSRQGTVQSQHSLYS